MLETRAKTSENFDGVKQEPAKQTLAELYAAHQGKVSDKWAIYLKVYEQLFSPYRANGLRFLEIGIQNGGSLEIWGKYFVNAASLIGCDINVACAQLRYEDPRIQVVVGDANLDETERAIAVHADRFDIVIDDGSHRSSDIIRSFVRYFPRLQQGGIFVVEDLHCSYWQEFEGGLVDPWSSMSYLKRLADVINHEHWGVPHARAEVLRSFESCYGTALDEESLAQIHSIEFYNSVCVIRKCARVENELGPRVMAGNDAITDAEALMALRGALPVPAAQNTNSWSVLPPLPEDELLELRSQKESWLRAEAEWSVEGTRLRVGLDMKSQQLDQVQQELQQIQQQLTSTQAQSAEWNRDLIAHRHEIQTIRASTSWRLTAPVRKLAHFLRRR